MTGLASRALVDRGAPAATCPAPFLPMSGLNGPGPGLRTATGPVRWALGVTVCGLAEWAHVRMAVARPCVTGPGHTGPATGHVTALPSPWIVCSLESGVGGLGGVAGIAWRFQPPGITVTLSQEWNLPL